MAMTLSKDEKRLVSLQKIRERRLPSAETAKSLIGWYMEHQSWTVNQRGLADRIINAAKRAN